MRYASFACAVALASALAFGAAAPASAQQSVVRDAVADLTDALEEIRKADGYFADESNPSILSSLGEWTSTIIAIGEGPNGSRNLRNIFQSRDLRRLTQKDRFVAALRQNVQTQARDYNPPVKGLLKDIFYREFIGVLLTSRNTPENGRGLVRRLFGPEVGRDLIRRYEQAVSDTKRI